MERKHIVKDKALVNFKVARVKKAYCVCLFFLALSH